MQDILIITNSYLGICWPHVEKQDGYHGCSLSVMEKCAEILLLPQVFLKVFFGLIRAKGIFGFI